MINKYLYILTFLFSFDLVAKDEFVVPETLINQVTNGNAEAAYFIATTFLEGFDEFVPNYDKGLEWLKKSANMGYAHAMLAYARELTSEEKYEQALDWHTKAANEGLGEAMDQIALYHYLGRAGLAKDCLLAYQWFEKAELKQIKQAYNNHAWYLATSEDEKCRNPEKAVKVVSNLMSLFDVEDLVPWYIWDTKAAVLASVSDFSEAIKLQQWLIDEMKKVDYIKPIYQEHLDSYKQRKPWLEIPKKSSP